MKKIILATIGLAMFATPLAAENPHSGYPGGERDTRGGTAVSSFNHAQAPERFVVAPSATTQSFALTVPRPRAGLQSSTGGLWPDQDLRDRYGRISR